MARMLQYFFAPPGKYPPCGMFTVSHIAAALSCVLFSVAAAVLLYKRVSDRLLGRIVLCFTAVLWVCEAGKICHAFYYGQTGVDAWVPLSYCSLFLVSLLLYRCSGEFLRGAAETYIGFAAPIAGLSFMIFPTTSLTVYPIWHYLSLYSLLLHSSMIFVGLIFFLRCERLPLDRFINYAVFVMGCCSVAISLNSVLDANLMNLREPYHIPLSWIQAIYSALPGAFTVLAIAVYLIIPLALASCTGKLIK